MLVSQHNIGTELYRLRNNPLDRLHLPEDGWRRYARSRRDRFGYYTYRQADIDLYAEVGRHRKFASRLASMTAELEYEGKTLFAIQTGFYCEGGYYDHDGYVWSGVTDEHHAFTIRGFADYQAAHDHYLSDEDEYGYDETSYSLVYVAAPTSIIR